MLRLLNPILLNVILSFYSFKKYFEDLRVQVHKISNIFTVKISKMIFAKTRVFSYKTLLAFALLNFVLQGQIFLLLQVSLDSPLLHSNPLWWERTFFGRWILKGFIVLIECINFSFFDISVWVILLGLLKCWMFCLGSKQRSFCHFEVAPNTAFWTLVAYRS